MVCVAIRATHVATETDITIGPFIDPVSQAVIDEVYQGRGAGVLECREHDDHPDLAQLRDPVDGRVHGAWVYLRKSRDKRLWQLVHLANGIGREFRTHEIPVGKSAEHQWQQDYYERAAQYAGYQTAQEVALSTDTRLDLTITRPGRRVRCGDPAQSPGGAEGAGTHPEGPQGGHHLDLVGRSQGPGLRSRSRMSRPTPCRTDYARADPVTVTTGPRRVIKARCEPENFQRCPYQSVASSWRRQRSGPARKSRVSPADARQMIQM